MIETPLLIRRFCSLERKFAPSDEVFSRLSTALSTLWKASVSPDGSSGAVIAACRRCIYAASATLPVESGRDRRPFVWKDGDYCRLPLIATLGRWARTSRSGDDSRTNGRIGPLSGRFQGLPIEMTTSTGSADDSLADPAGQSPLMSYPQFWQDGDLRFPQYPQFPEALVEHGTNPLGRQRAGREAPHGAALTRPAHLHIIVGLCPRAGPL